MATAKKDVSLNMKVSLQPYHPERAWSKYEGEILSLEIKCQHWTLNKFQIIYSKIKVHFTTTDCILPLKLLLT